MCIESLWMRRPNYYKSSYIVLKSLDSPKREILTDPAL
jgi:hypothetical protein